MNNKPKTNRAGNKNKVSQMDVCQTPPHAIEPLLPYIPQDWVIWESAAGPEQLIIKAFAKHGYTNIIGSDLLYGDKYNFFTYDPAYDKDYDHFPFIDTNWHIQITNMPFSIKYEWLKRSFEFAKPFALLAPYETTFAKEFQLLFAKYSYITPIEVLSPERRINYKMPNTKWGVIEWSEKKQKYVKRGESAQMPTAWLTWGLEIYKTRQDYLRTYYVPMRSVKYNDDNTEKK